MTEVRVIHSEGEAITSTADHGASSDVAADIAVTFGAPPRPELSERLFPATSSHSRSTWVPIALKDSKHPEKHILDEHEQPLRGALFQKEPPQLEKVEKFLRSLESSDIAGLRALKRSEELVPLVTELLFPSRKPTETEFAAIVKWKENVHYERSKWLGILDPITWPTPVMKAPDFTVSRDVAQSTMAIIGDGPAAVIYSRLRSELGYPASRTVVFSPTGELDGIWKQPNVLFEGHNTFARVNALGPTLPAAAKSRHTGEELGNEVREFLSELWPTRAAATKGRVVSVNFVPELQKYSVVHEDQGVRFASLFDSVLVCPGNRIPRSLDGGPMMCGREAMKLTTLKRWQHEIPRSEWQSFNNTSPVLVGLGNSTMAMVHQFLRMQREAKINVTPRILTHVQEATLRNPDKYVWREHGRSGFESPVFRTPSDLSRVSGDLPRVREDYFEALNRGWIIPDVYLWEVEAGRPFSKVTAHVTRTVFTIDRVPSIYALIGYQNDPQRMRDLSCEVADLHGTVVRDEMTNTVKSLTGGNRLYVAGAAASTVDDRNQELIPGMMGVLARIAFTDIVRAAGRRPRPPE